ncbi:MAG: porin family protein [Chlorobiaceae bacterium]|nr:porin family protein [Chlorobiaceae bacterium]
MKNILYSLLAAGLFAAPSLSHAATNPYVSISGGTGFMTNATVNGTDDAIAYETGYLINGAVGLRSGSVRIEAEVGYHQNDFKYPVFDDNIAIWSFMANGYYDISLNESGITPYVMAGLGVANVTWNYTGADDNDTAFAWQVGAGLGFKVADRTTIDVGYRYFATADVTLYGNEVSVGSHNIVAGVRFDL